MQRILVAIDGSEPSTKAVDLAADLAVARGAAVIVLHVVPREPIPPALAAFAKAEGIPLEEEVGRWHDARRLGDALTRDAAERLRGRGVTAVETLVEEGTPARAIVEVARGRAVDAIVLGSRGRGALAAALLGSVAQRVAQEAPCTCIIVR